MRDLHPESRRRQRLARMTSGDTTARGYGTHHQLERERWRRQVEAGRVDCWRCGQRIQPGEPWDLGHDDTTKDRYRGPEHRGCNRATKNRQTGDPQPTQRTNW